MKSPLYWIDEPMNIDTNWIIFIWLLFNLNELFQWTERFFFSNILELHFNKNEIKIPKRMGTIHCKKNLENSLSFARFVFIIKYSLFTIIKPYFYWFFFLFFQQTKIQQNLLENIGMLERIWFNKIYIFLRR